MTDVIFYEKAGCANNARQKILLEKAGHRLEIRDLLTENWTVETLRLFFGSRPVAEWFNQAAPRIKNGAIDPAALGADEALALMLAEPILIRRPLIEVAGQRVVGFDPNFIDSWIGLSEAAPKDDDLETCRRVTSAKGSPRDEAGLK
jgi:nitrogenase-associated protein